MKQYKHIPQAVERTSDGKVFKIGDEIKLKGDRYGGLHSKNNVYKISSFETDAVKFDATLGLSLSTIDNWVKVGEEEETNTFTITALRSVDSNPNIITYEHGGGCYNTKGFADTYKSRENWLNAFLKWDRLWQIHSVRRESDKVEFSIGDKFKIGYSNYTITKLYFLVAGTIRMIGINENNASFDGYLENVKKVEDKEWEILSFKHDKKQHLAILNTQLGNYCVSGFGSGYSLEYCLKYYKIHSVKRLSDGVVFTVGDVVGDLGDTPIQIDAFKVNDIKNHPKEGDINMYNSGVYFQNISTSKPPKKPLFTTEDGVDIFEGQPYVFIIRKLKGEILGNDWDLREQSAARPQHIHQDKTYPGKYINFSTKEAAEEYIIMNKPCLSIMDIITYDGRKDYGMGMPALSRTKFIELVKTKLK